MSARKTPTLAEVAKLFDQIDAAASIENLREAQHEILMAWAPNVDAAGEDETETARHLMNALLDIELAMVPFERVRMGPNEDGSEGRDLASTLATKAAVP